MKKLEGGLRLKGKSKKKPLITIVTVVRNGEKTLERTIKSVINQTYKNMEYIIIDGDSTDKTLDIIKRYNSKIDYWMSEPDKGIYDAMNKGILLAKGDYIQFMNADDYILNKKVIEKISNMLIKEYPEILYGQYKTLSGLWPMKDVTFKVRKGYETFPHQSTFMKRELLKSLGMFNLRYPLSGDTDLFYRSMKRNPSIIFVNMPVAFFDHRGASSKIHLKQSLEVAYKNFGLRSALYHLFVGHTKNLILKTLDWFGLLDWAKRMKAKLQKI